MKTYTPTNSMVVCTGTSGDYCNIQDYKQLRRKALELAEAILMDWNNAADIARKFLIEDNETFKLEE